MDEEKEREREAPTPVGWTRLASTTSDVATAQQSPGLPSLSTFSPSRREMGDPPRHHPPHAACRPRTPHLFQGHGSIPTSVRASVRTSVRKLAATAVMPVCIRDPAKTYVRVSGVRDKARASLIVRDTCQICDIEPTGTRISLKISYRDKCARLYDVSFRFASRRKSCP